ncbi:septal ring lytic transglycosylase RlpA family protein [Actinomadura decatromicini]|uniref:Probable endolytic peptidoglycan transglycosylase RlpA n=1 Tax=Actinomadura decatromicini TaxID=2604572 RepID=A0A5D3FRZ7_9ACTN|nr:septal ring lytic transglycosylase RlpA family protein [Actinomadura decatromicini]TYK50818.1 septal ring lytic transglycosylase RlpA family protein [Actinomadura decatromicini]
MGSPVRRLLRARLRAVLIVSGAAAAVLAVGAFALVKTDRPANSAAAAQAAPPTSLGDAPRGEPSRASRGGTRSPEPEPSPSSPAPKKTKPAKTEPDSTAAELAAPKKKQQFKVVRSGSCQASYYWEGQMTASGESFDPSELTAAHKTLPMGTKVRVTNKNNGRSVIVRINDRGPYAGGRCLDLSKAAMQKVGGTGSGVIPVRYQVLSRD